MEPILALGGAIYPTDHHTGLAILPEDSDGVYRRHQRVYELQYREAPIRMPSFPWAIVSAAQNREPLQNAPSGDLLLNFSGDVYNLTPTPVSEVLRAQGPGWAEGMFKDKIVLLGGTYTYAHDQHATPIGSLSGLQIMEQTVESEMVSGGIDLWIMPKIMLLEVMVGLVLACLHYCRPIHKALPLSVVEVLVLGAACRYLAIRSFAMWISFLPIWIAVLIHHGFDLAHENSELRDRNIELGRELARYTVSEVR